ncbi:MAG TPA: hypothetical protein VKR53_18985 [Puia sp.]|nr:hypothetical protein [Puia sp.]
MKKNSQHPPADALKNKTKSKTGLKIKRSTGKSSEDLGTMKIGKAHALHDDLESVNLKEKRK